MPLSSFSLSLSPVVRRRLLYALAALLVFALLALAVFLWQRQRLLNYALGEVKARVEHKYPVRLTLGPARFTDLNTVEIQGMSLVPTGAGGPPQLADTLLTARRLQAGLSARSLFAGRPVFSQLQIDAARLTALKTAAGDNFSFLLKKKAAAPRRDTTQGRNYGLLLNQVLETGFDNVPGEADFRNFVVRYLSPRHRVLLQMPGLRINDGQISGQMQADVDGEVNQLGLAGSVEPSDYAVDLRLYGRGQSVQLPYLPQRFNTMVSFDTVRVQLTGKEFNDEALTLRGSVAARNFSFYQPKVSATDVVVRSGALDFVTTLGPRSVALEQGSRIVLNKLVFYPEINLSRPLPPAASGNRRRRPARPPRTWQDDLRVSLNITSAQTPVNDFFSSLPEGIFDAVTGVRGTGSLKYELHAALDMAQVDSLKFDSSLRPAGNFAITQFGAEDLTQLNRDFLYTAYNDRGDSIKTFAVGPTNPDFVPYNQISNYLKTAITTAEDPRFFTHRGFMEKAFVKSAIQNIKERRFARGGSTISMQLVKNVFLTRQKVISRKIEEMLIVWLLENTRLVSKERMFEVYLNVIEWGPKIYGVKEAAKFYYNKQPADLNLDESLYLASIIPKPKYYRQSFDAYGNLRRNTRYFFRLIADLMEMRGQISSQDRAGLNYGVALNGRARQYIVTARDTTRTVHAADSSQFEPLNLLDLLNTGATTTPDAGVNSNAPEEDAPPPAPAPK